MVEMCVREADPLEIIQRHRGWKCRRVEELGAIVHNHALIVIFNKETSTANLSAGTEKC